MNRLYEAPAYAPLQGCFWSDFAPQTDWPRFDQDSRSDFAIIGGGFTGLTAALYLAHAGAQVTLLEAETPGFGASGRNGGFCCLGGAKASDSMLRRRVGAAGVQSWHDTEKAAVAHVEALLETQGWEVDRHSVGETLLAHNQKAWRAMKSSAPGITQAFGVTPHLLEPDALPQNGLGGPWHGALTIPLGFALNPRKYHSHLAKAASAAGADLRAKSPVTRIARDGDGWTLSTATGTLRAKRTLLATNGYSAENLPDWMRARTLPALSNIIVTRPLSPEERQAQGWTSPQMSYDSRALLHYFRLMPDGRFLFGMRGGLSASPRAQARESQRIQHNFTKLFPAWRDVEITHEWSGLACLLSGLTPFVGPVPDHAGLFAAMGFHGNGVAMGSYTGRLLAELALGHVPTGPYPAAIQTPPRRFPLGRFRRALLAPAYWTAERFDL